MLTKNA